MRNEMRKNFLHPSGKTPRLPRPAPFFLLGSTYAISVEVPLQYLLDQGYTNINSPKEVIKQAFAFGMIDDQKAWVELLNDRNLASHVYDEATAAAIFARIEGQYLPLFDRVTAYMKDE